MSRYAGWGGAIGTVIGTGYGITQQRRAPDDALKAPLVLVDAVAGFTIGVIAGGAIYVVRRVLR